MSLLGKYITIPFLESLSCPSFEVYIATAFTLLRVKIFDYLQPTENILKWAGRKKNRHGHIRRREEDNQKLWTWLYLGREEGVGSDRDISATPGKIWIHEN